MITKYKYLGTFDRPFVVKLFLDIHQNWFEEESNLLYGRYGQIYNFLSNWTLFGVLPVTTSIHETYIENRFEEWLTHWEPNEN